jgi:hypothetical protein
VRQIGWVEEGRISGPWGRLVSDMNDVSVREAGMLLTAAARRTFARRAEFNSAGDSY